MMGKGRHDSAKPSHSYYITRNTSKDTGRTRGTRTPVNTKQRLKSQKVNKGEKTVQRAGRAGGVTVNLEAATGVAPGLGSRREWDFSFLGYNARLEIDCGPRKKYTLRRGLSVCAQKNRTLNGQSGANCQARAAAGGGGRCLSP